MAYCRDGGPDAGATDAAVMEHPKAGGAAPRRRQKDRREGPASIPTNWRGQIFDVCTTIPSQTRMKRRAEFELVIGHLTTEHRMDRSHLEGREGDRINAAPPPPAITSAGSCAGWPPLWCVMFAARSACASDSRSA
jgi:hypothetical protein